MALAYYVLPITVCVLCAQAIQSIKVLYCQDPDTGILHPVNTTWPSSSFCGNYTCKIRRKNISSDDVAPLKKINITDININVLKSEEDMTHGASEHVGTKIHPGIAQFLNREKYGHDNEIEQQHSIVNETSKASNDDGYLTEAEIKIISDMLHTVKKSDLEAIVEIYNLAQDIYRDVDQHQGDTLYQDTMTPIRTHDPSSQDITNKEKPTSYWYEPLHFHSAKVKSQSEAKSDATTSPNTVQTTVSTNRDNSNSYFRGSLTEKDFRKLPYYYSGNLQRAPTYGHNVKQNEPHINTEGKPCKKPAMPNNYALPPWINNSLRKHYASGTHHKCLEPAMLLPYPFAYVNNNLSGYPPQAYYNAYSGYPWPQVSRNYQQSYIGTAYASHPSKSVFVKAPTEEEIELQPNSITKEDIIDIISTLKDKETNKMPDWQTNPLPEKVIEEVRGNAEKSKIIKTPLRRKIRLERVDKVIKIDENLRPKRSIMEFDNNFGKADDFESYLTKITCEPSTELGFFRRGNMSKLFPACCPERIEQKP